MSDYAKGNVWVNNLIFCALAGVLWYICLLYTSFLFLTGVTTGYQGHTFQLRYSSIGNQTEYSLFRAYTCLLYTSTCIGNGKMKTVTMQIMPETGSYNMSQRICKIMCHHLRFSCSTRSEIHQ